MLEEDTPHLASEFIANCVDASANRHLGVPGTPISLTGEIPKPPEFRKERNNKNAAQNVNCTVFSVQVSSLIHDGSAL
jgi:hypothetical protein